MSQGCWSILMQSQLQEFSMIARIFLDHPAKVDETFFEHMAFALKFSGLLFAASVREDRQRDHRQALRADA